MARRRDAGHDPETRSLGWTGRFRYSRWDGSQRLPDLGADEILDALSDDLMAEGDLADALQRLFQRGLPRRRDGRDQEGLAGLRDLLARLAQRRRDLLERYQLGDVLGDVRQELEEIVETERHGIERRLAEAASGEDATEDLRRMMAEMAADGRRRWTSCPRMPASGSASSRTTTSWSRRRASASNRSSTDCASKSLTPTSRGSPSRSRA